LGASDRIMICYKNAQLDPLLNVDNTNVTVRWRDAPLNRPENAVIGEMFSGITPNGSPGYPFVVTNSSSWVYSGVDVTTNSARTTGHARFRIKPGYRRQLRVRERFLAAGGAKRGHDGSRVVDRHGGSGGGRGLGPRAGESRAAGSGRHRAAAAAPQCL